MAIGLQSQIWNNNLRSIMLLLLYPVLMAFLVWLCAFVISIALAGNEAATTNALNFATNILYEFWPTLLTVILVWFLIAFFFHSNMIRKLSHAHSIERKDEPALYNLLENLCITQGMTMPKLNIIETHARNAFASGINETSYTVTLTRGLINSLKKDELEAVIAHELTHIQNHDVRLLMITVIFTGMLGFAAQMMWSTIRYRLIFGGHNCNKNSSMSLIFIIAVILWIGYLATLVMRFALSRTREYMADSGALQMTKNPEALMRALMRISGRDHIPEAPQDIALMCIENHKAFLGIFATHPPIQKRIQTISQLTNTPIPQLDHTGPAPKAERFNTQSQNKNPWLIRNRRPSKKI